MMQIFWLISYKNRKKQLHTNKYMLKNISFTCLYNVACPRVSKLFSMLTCAVEEIYIVQYIFMLSNNRRDKDAEALQCVC